MPSAAIVRESPRTSPPATDALQTYEEALANAEPGDTIATTKEEEWLTRKQKEVTTTRQIATRVKRELVLEDGRVLMDSGPKVSTSTHEDTYTTNYHQSEHRVPENADANAAIDQPDGPFAKIGGASGLVEGGGAIAPIVSTVSARVVANPEGKVRESRDHRELVRNVTDHVREVEERFHRGDTTHQALISAVNETEDDDIREALKKKTVKELSLVPHGPQLIKETTSHNKTVDTEDSEELRALRPDGTIVTETKRTTGHEKVRDQDLAEDADEARSLASAESVNVVRSGRERRARVETEKSTELMAGGRRVATQIHSKTKHEEAEREGDLNMEDPYDWDSLSMRMRRQRRLRHNSDLDKDYAKRPLDLDVEEETRKKETSKWLENHFGSDSPSSHDSIAEEIGRRPNFYPSKAKQSPDEGYYGKTPTTSPPPPVYADRTLRKTKSSSPSDEHIPISPKTNGYFKGITEWSQRRASKPRMPEPRSSSPSPPIVRSPYASNDRLNTTSPKHIYKRDSPQDVSPPLGRRVTRNPPSREDSAYVSSSTMHSPPRGSPLREVDERRYREQSPDAEYHRPPVAPERKRHSKHRSPDDQPYDSGYRSSSRNETSGRSRDSRDESAPEPPPDYSPPPPRERRRSDERSPSRRRDERKLNQKTRFAENGRRRSPARKFGASISNSIRKLVGKIRSASAERRARWNGVGSRSPSPEHTSRTYRGYDSDLAPPPAPAAAPAQRYYLGEDPFAGSIYGREHKYEGASPRRTSSRDQRNSRGSSDRSQHSTTLGRFSHSTSRLNPNIEQDEEYSRTTQTLPRKLHDKRNAERQEKQNSDKRWTKIAPSKRSNSAVNVSLVETHPEIKHNGHVAPVKPARSYKVLNRSKSFAMGAPETETHPRYVSGMTRNYSTMYKSNPHLSRLDETPEQLKSPGIVSIINRSQRDLADAVSREAERRKDGLFGTRYGKISPVNGHSNGYGKDETDQKNIFLKGLKDRAPELYQSLHRDEDSEGSKLSSRYGTPSPIYRERTSEERRVTYRPDTYVRETSPFVSKFDSRLRSSPRRGSHSSDNYSETYKYSTKSGDPDRPSVTDTVETVSKKVIPSKDGRSKEIIQSREVKSYTTTKSKEPLTTTKYLGNGRLSSERNGRLSSERNGTPPLYSEKRNSSYKVTERVHGYRT